MSLFSAGVRHFPEVLGLVKDRSRSCFQDFSFIFGGTGERVQGLANARPYSQPASHFRDRVSLSCRQTWEPSASASAVEQLGLKASTALWAVLRITDFGVIFPVIRFLLMWGGPGGSPCGVRAGGPWKWWTSIFANTSRGSSLH